MKASKVDYNQPEIVDALRKAGASVEHLHKVGKGCPDILVGFRGVNYLMEIKTPEKASKLNAKQVEWHGSWRGSVHIVRTVDEALNLILR